MQQIEHLSDIAIRLESFAGSQKETNPLFKDYHGLLHLQKMLTLNTIAPHNPDSRDLAFKLRRKKFVIEVNSYINNIIELMFINVLYVCNFSCLFLF